MTDAERLDVEFLEGAVDRLGLREVIEHLASICSEKAEHLRSNWQDERSAARWDADTERLERAAGHLHLHY